MESAKKKEEKRKRGGPRGKRYLDDDDDDEEDYGEPDREADGDDLYYGKNHFYEVLIQEGKAQDFEIKAFRVSDRREFESLGDFASDT